MDQEQESVYQKLGIMNMNQQALLEGTFENISFGDPIFDEFTK